MDFFRGNAVSYGRPAGVPLALSARARVGCARSVAAPGAANDRPRREHQRPASPTHPPTRLRWLLRTARTGAHLPSLAAAEPEAATRAAAAAAATLQSLPPSQHVLPPRTPQQPSCRGCGHGTACRCAEHKEAQASAGGAESSVGGRGGPAEEGQTQAAQHSSRRLCHSRSSRR